MAGAFDLIVFDWDGTLMDSTATIVLSIQQACRDLDLPVPTREQASHVIGLGLADALAHAVPSLPRERVPDLVARYRHHYLSRDHDLVLFDGVRELLVGLKERGYLLAVATGKSRLGLDRALRVSGLGPLFDATRCADESFSKPHPAMLASLIDELLTSASATLMVGDTTHDLQMAVNAGTHGLGVSYGAHPIDQLEHIPSRGVVHSVDELAAWLACHG